MKATGVVGGGCDLTTQAEVAWQTSWHFWSNCVGRRAVVGPFPGKNALNSHAVLVQISLSVGCEKVREWDAHHEAKKPPTPKWILGNLGCQLLSS